ncbi:hypothetical protein RUND412_009299 [Rhizina undulata]
MFSKNVLFLLLSVLGSVFELVGAQQSSAYVDSDTGISFQRFYSSSYGYSFGIALPTDPTTEFIGQIVGPINTDGGWSGVSFGGTMTSNLLFIAWPNGEDIVYSFRYVTGYLEPGVYDGDSVATPMYTKVNSTHFSLTFRCQNCVSWTSGSFDPTASYTIMGWAQSSSAVGNVSDSASTIQYHDNGFGEYGMLIGSALSDQYSTWLTAAGIDDSTSTSAAPTATATTSATTATVIPAATATLGTYDYIVVGGGAGGLVAADRLSETGKSVLLIERGPPSTYATGGTIAPDWLIGENLTRFDVPGLCNEIWVDSAGIACDDIDQMAGCILGGGTAVNTGLFFRPMDRDWDYNFPSGWQSSDMRSATDKVFTRIPSTDTPSMDGIRYLQESYTVLSTALSENGWSNVTINNTPNSKNRTFSHTPFMYSNGERGGPLATYLQTALARSNFELAVNTTVRRVIRTGSTITGVEVLTTQADGLTGIVNVTPTTGKVILSAGAFGTPKILFRSGIGPSDQLDIVAASIADGESMISSDEWISLPVGYNVMDHTNTDVVVSHPNVTEYDFYAAYDDPITADKDAYLNNRAGMLAGAAPGPNTMLWESFVGDDGITRQVQWTARAEGSLGETGDTYVTISQYLGTGMTSRGRMTIESNLDMEISVSPYLNDANDVDAVIKGVASLMASTANVSGITFIQPAAGVDAETFVYDYYASRRSNHWLGTCKLGTDDGRNGNGTTGAVVDLNTKVYGTDNLFVVDASIFPGHVATNPSAPIMIAAERAIELILALESSTSTSAAASATSKTSSTATTSATTTTGSAVAHYGQCGGINYTGSTTCATGYTCTYLNDYYYQCL